MAVVLHRKNLTRRDEEFLVQMLTFQPQEKNSYYQQLAGDKKAFYFWESSPDWVKVPYAFGITFLRRFPHDHRAYQTTQLQFKGHLRPRQQKKAQKLDRNFSEYRTATLCGHTGFGKTIMATYYLAKFKLLTVVLVPGTILMEQWPKAIRNFIDGVDVKMVGEDYFGNEKTPDVLVCMPERWKKIPPEVRDQVGFLVVDEAHMFCTASRCVSILQFQPKYILALTASPYRRDGTIGVLQALCGLHRVIVKYLNLVTVWQFKTGLTFPTIKDARMKPIWASTLKKIVESEEANQMIADLTAYLVAKGRKPLLMTDRKSHVDDLSQKLKSRGICYDYLMGKKNKYQDSPVLVAIMKKAGVGFDEQFACPHFEGTRIDTVIYCTSFQEINALIQYGGRAFRADNPLIIHVVHKNGILEKHWRVANDYYQSREFIKNTKVVSVRPADLFT